MITLDAPTDAERETRRQRSQVRRNARTRSNIVAGCRVWFMEGRFRPTVPEIARRAGVSVRTVFHYFPKVEGLYVAALDQGAVIDIHRQLELLGPTELVTAAVLGRLPQ